MIRRHLADRKTIALHPVDDLPVEGLVNPLVRGQLKQIRMAIGSDTGRRLSGPNVDDTKTGVRMIKNARYTVKAVIGGAACDSREIYEAAEGHGARVVVSSFKNARISRCSPQARDRSVERIAKVISCYCGIMRFPNGETTSQQRTGLEELTG